MCQISETFYLGLASFGGLGQIVFFHFSWQFQDYYGPFLAGSTRGGLRLSLPLCSSPCARLRGFACAEELLQGTTGEQKTHFFLAASAGQTSVGIRPLRQHGRTCGEGVGRTPGKARESRSGCL